MQRNDGQSRRRSPSPSPSSRVRLSPRNSNVTSRVRYLTDEVLEQRIERQLQQSSTRISTSNSLSSDGGSTNTMGRPRSSSLSRRQRSLPASVDSDSLLSATWSGSAGGSRRAKSWSMEENREQKLLFQAVTELDLRPQIKNEKFHVIENLSQLSNLVSLNLADNAISKIENLDLPQLSRLVLDNNRITVIENLEHCPKLEILSLRGNIIARLSGQSTRRSFKALQQLRELHLEDNRLSHLHDVKALAVLGNLSQLTILKGNPIASLEHARSYIVFAINTLSVLEGEEIQDDLRSAARLRFEHAEIDLLKRENAIKSAEIEDLRRDAANKHNEILSIKESIGMLRAKIGQAEYTNQRLQDELEAKSVLLDKKSRELQRLFHILYTTHQRIEFLKVDNPEIDFSVSLPDVTRKDDEYFYVYTRNGPQRSANDRDTDVPVITSKAIAKRMEQLDSEWSRKRALLLSIEHRLQVGKIREKDLDSSVIRIEAELLAMQEELRQLKQGSGLENIEQVSFGDEQSSAEATEASAVAHTSENYTNQSDNSRDNSNHSEIGLTTEDAIHLLGDRAHHILQRIRELQRQIEQQQSERADLLGALQEQTKLNDELKEKQEQISEQVHRIDQERRELAFDTGEMFSGTPSGDHIWYQIGALMHQTVPEDEQISDIQHIEEPQDVRRVIEEKIKEWGKLVRKKSRVLMSEVAAVPPRSPPPPSQPVAMDTSDASDSAQRFEKEIADLRAQLGKGRSDKLQDTARIEYLESQLVRCAEEKEELHLRIDEQRQSENELRQMIDEQEDEIATLRQKLQEYTNAADEHTQQTLHSTFNSDDDDQSVNSDKSVTEEEPGLNMSFNSDYQRMEIEALLEQLQEQLREKVAEVSELKSASENKAHEFSQLELENEELRVQIADTEEILESLQEQLQDTTMEAQELREQLKQQQSEFIDLSLRLKEADNELANVKSELENVEKDRDSAISARDSIQAQLDSIRADTEQKNSLLTEKENTISTLKAELQEFAKKLEQTENSLHNTEHQMQEQEQENALLQEKLRALEEMESDFETVRVQLLKIEDDLQTQLECTARVRGELEEKEAEAAALESKCIQYEQIEKELRNLKSTVSEKETHISELENRMADRERSFRHTLHTAEEQNKSLEKSLGAEISTLRERIVEKEEEISVLKESYDHGLAEREAQISELQNAVTKLKEEKKKLEEEFEAAREQTDSTRRRLESQIGELEKAVMKHLEEKNQIESAEEDAMNELREAINKAERRNVMLEGEVQHLRKREEEQAQHNVHLEESIREKNAQLEILRNSMNHTQEEFERLQRESEETMNHLQMEQQKSIQLQSEIDKLQNTESELKTTIHDLERVAHERQEQLSELQSELSTVQQELAEAKKSLVEREERTATLDATVANIMTEKSKLENTIEELGKSIELLQARESELSEHLESSEQRCQDLSTELETLRHQLRSQSNEMGQLEDALETCRKEADTAKIQCVEYQAEILELESRVVDVEDNCLRHREQLHIIADALGSDSVLGIIRCENANLQNVKRDVEQLRSVHLSDLSTLANKCKELETQVQESEQQRKALLAENRDLKPQLAVLQEQFDLSEDTRKQLEQDIEILRTQIAEMSDTVADVERDAREAWKQRESIEKQRSDEKEELERLRAMEAELTRQLEQLSEKAEGVSQENIVLKQKLDAKLALLEEQKAAVNAAQEEAEKLKTSVAELEEKLARSEELCDSNMLGLEARETEIALLESEKTSLLARYKELQEKMSGIQSKHDEVYSERESVMWELQAAEERIVDLERALEEAQEANEATLKQLEESQKHGDHVELELTSMQSELNALRASKELLSSEVTALRQQMMEAFSETIGDIIERLLGSEAFNDEYGIAELESGNDYDSPAAHELHLSASHQLQKRLETLTQFIAKRMETRERLLIEIDELEEKKADIEQQCATLMESNDELQQKWNEIEEMVSVTTEECEHLEMARAAIVTNKKEIEQEMQQKEASLLSQQRRIDQLKEERENLESEIADCIERTKDAEHEMDIIQAQKLDLMNDIETARAELIDITQQVDKVRHDHEQLMQDLSAKREHIKTLKAQEDEKSNAIASAAAELARLEQSIQQAQTFLQRHEKRMQLLKSELDKVGDHIASSSHGFREGWQEHLIQQIEALRARLQKEHPNEEFELIISTKKEYLDTQKQLEQLAHDLLASRQGSLLTVADVNIGDPDRRQGDAVMAMSPSQVQSLKSELVQLFNEVKDQIKLLHEQKKMEGELKEARSAVREKELVIDMLGKQIEQFKTENVKLERAHERDLAEIGKLNERLHGAQAKLHEAQIARERSEFDRQNNLKRLLRLILQLKAQSVDVVHHLRSATDLEASVAANIGEVPTPAPAPAADNDNDAIDDLLSVERDSNDAEISFVLITTELESVRSNLSNCMHMAIGLASTATEKDERISYLSEQLDSFGRRISDILSIEKRDQGTQSNHIIPPMAPLRHSAPTSPRQWDSVRVSQTHSLLLFESDSTVMSSVSSTSIPADMNIHRCRTAKERIVVVLRWVKCTKEILRVSSQLNEDIHAADEQMLSASKKRKLTLLLRYLLHSSQAAGSARTSRQRQSLIQQPENEIIEELRQRIAELVAQNDALERRLAERMGRRRRP